MSIMRSRWLLLILALIAISIPLVVHFMPADNGKDVLHASGTIEATKVDVSFQRHLEVCIRHLS